MHVTDVHMLFQTDSIGIQFRARPTIKIRTLKRNTSYTKINSTVKISGHATGVGSARLSEKGDDLQVYRTDANILNEQSRTTDKG
jgi:hypothetical protein